MVNMIQVVYIFKDYILQKLLKNRLLCPYYILGLSMKNYQQSHQQSLHLLIIQSHQKNTLASEVSFAADTSNKVTTSVVKSQINHNSIHSFIHSQIKILLVLKFSKFNASNTNRVWRNRIEDEDIQRKFKNVSHRH